MTKQPNKRKSQRKRTWMQICSHLHTQESCKNTKLEAIRSRKLEESKQTKNNRFHDFTLRDKQPPKMLLCSFWESHLLLGTGTSLKDWFAFPNEIPYRKRMFHFKWLSIELASWLWIGACFYIPFQL